MPYQRGRRDYGPSSTGGTTKYSSRRQVSIGVPDRKSRKPVQVRPAKPAKKDPGVAGVTGGLTRRGQAALTAKPAKRDPSVMGTSGGLTGRGQNNPARTDPHVMGVPGGVTGRKPSTSRMTSPAGSSEYEPALQPTGPNSSATHPSFNQLPKARPAKERPSTNSPNRGRSAPANGGYGLTFTGPVNGLPWASGQLPLASSPLANLRLDSLEPKSPQMTAEEQQELDFYRKKREAFRRGETITRNAWELNAKPSQSVSAQRQIDSRKGSAPGAAPDLFGTQGESVFDLGMAHTVLDHLQMQTAPSDLRYVDPTLQSDNPGAGSALNKPENKATSALLSTRPASEIDWAHRSMHGPNYVHTREYAELQAMPGGVKRHIDSGEFRPRHIAKTRGPMLAAIILGLADAATGGRLSFILPNLGLSFSNIPASEGNRKIEPVVKF